MDKAIEINAHELARIRHDHAAKKQAKLVNDDNLENDDNIKDLMKDENMVERYSKHLTAILLGSQEGFLKRKYEEHVAATQPKEGSFFDRM
jgi:hypothetical protein